jgi:succinate dehydrogenase / fumarate reductase membrane anchor subunit
MSTSRSGMRTTLGRVRGLGSSHDGVGHWWAQRLTAVALAPLVIWFVISALSLMGADYAEFQAWLGTFGNAVLLILLAIALFHHAQLGIQVVIEDYVHAEAPKMIGLIATKFIAAVAGASTVLAIVKVAVSG